MKVYHPSLSSLAKGLEAYPDVRERIIMDYVVHGWDMPYDSPEVGAYNRAVRTEVEKIMSNSTLSLIQKLSRLGRLRPYTKRTVHPNLTPEYLDAVAEIENAMVKIVSSLPTDERFALRWDLIRPYWYNTMTLNDVEKIVRIEHDETNRDFDITIMRKEKKDKWYLVINDQVSPTYANFGRLSTRHLDAVAHIRYSHCGRIVISVFVDTKTDVFGGVACEAVVEGDQVHFSPWIEHTFRDHILLPHVTEFTLHSVRLGDLLIRVERNLPCDLAPVSDEGRYWFIVNFLNSLTLPLEVGNSPVYITNWGDIFFKTEARVFTHPKYRYQVRAGCHDEGNDGRITGVVIRRVAGSTQYLPCRGMD